MSHLRPIAILCLALLAAAPAAAHQKAYILADAQSGVILAQENADASHAPASLTKMMLLFMTFRAIDDGRLSFDDTLTVSSTAAAKPAVKLGLKAGATITVRDAVMIVVTRSSNDVAVVLAEALGGTESDFAVTMTIKARELGMTRTTFRNATGLPDPEQVSSARDMLVLGLALMNEFPEHYELFATNSFSYGGQTYGNTNRLLRSYAGMDGLKTGYTRAAGYNLAASAQRSGERMIAVVLGQDSPAVRDREMRRLLDAGFAGAASTSTHPSTAGQTAVPTLTSAQSPAVNAWISNDDARLGWGIELGAHTVYDQARGEAEAAMARLPRFAGTAKLSILPTAIKTGSVYHARLLGMSEEQAIGACQSLGATIPCAPVSPEGITIAGAY